MEHIHRTINSERTVSKTSKEDNNETICTQVFIHKNGVVKNLDFTIIGKTVNQKPIAKDNDCTIIDPGNSDKRSLSSPQNENYKKKRRSKDLVQIGVEPIPIIIDEDSEKDYDRIMSYNGNGNFPPFVSNNTITKDQCGIFVPKTLDTEKALAKDEDCTVVTENLSYKEAMAKDKYIGKVAKCSTRKKTMTKDNCSILAEETVEKDMDCIILAKTPSNQGAKENIVESTIIGSANSDKSSLSSAENGSSINKNCKENNQLIDLVDNSIESTPIIIDDDTEKDNDCTILDNDNVNLLENISKHTNINENTSHHKNIFNNDDIFKENKLMAELIEKCLDMESSKTMLRLINRTLIPLYKDADVKYRKSAVFEKAITLTMNKLETKPDLKFTHLQALIELLKETKVKKRLTLTTLKRNLNGNFSSNNISGNHISSKKKKIDIIDLDDDDDDKIHIECNSDTDVQISNVSQVVEVDSSSEQDNDSDIQINEESEKVTEDKDHNEDIVLIDDDSANSSKENRSTRSGKNANRCKSLTPSANKQKDIRNLSNTGNTVTEAIDLCNETNETGNNSNKVFNPGDVSSKICKLEVEIAACNVVIKKLDEEEVTDDDYRSPYVRSEYYKQRIVSLYKEICKLIGSEAVKQHKVTLTGAEGHHPGPVKCLEDFINYNIDEHGEPPFPDLTDVLFCVRKANTIYNMGWTLKEIDSEARSLFIYYGLTIKKRRQMREWKYLMQYVEEEAPDPATEDPTLEARLVENSAIAKKNEDELINRYVELENSSNPLQKCLNMRVEVEESDKDSDYGSTSPTPSVPNLSTTKKRVDSEQTSVNSEKESSTSGHSTNKVAIYNATNIYVLLPPISQSTNIGSICNLKEISSTATYVTGTDINEKVILSDHKTCGTNVILTQANLDVRTDSGVPSIMPQDIGNLRPASEVATPIVKSLPGLNNVEVSRLSNEINSNKVTNFESDIPVNTKMVNDHTPKATDACGSSLPGLNNVEVSRLSNEINSNKITNLESDIPVNTVMMNKDIPKATDACGSSKNHTLGLDAGSPQTKVNRITLKSEPLDIPYMLEQLGDNYTASIIDIEDPFMVIEISDSSDSEDESIN